MSRSILYVTAVAAVVLCAGGLRVYAAQRLNVDYDEPVYLGDAVGYARAMRLGEFKMLAWDQTTSEHPPLYKILYGIVLLTQPPLDRLPAKDLPRLAPLASAAAAPWNVADRYLSVFWGTLAVLTLAVVNPLAGLFLGISTLSVKYTSEVYLEALPVFSSLLCAMTYGRWFAKIRLDPDPSTRNTFWLVLSGVFLGITAASKYVYCVVGLGILAHFLVALVQKQIPPRTLRYFAGWAVLSVLMFFVFDPYLWPHPIGRLVASILYHVEFQDSRLVLQYHYPFWQPLRWLSAFSSYYDLGPAGAFILDFDTLLFALAVLGLPRLLRTQPLFFYWLAVGLVFLLAWNTKWPQYTLIILAPFSLAAAQGASTLWDLAQRLLRRNSPSTAVAK